MMYDVQYHRLDGIALTKLLLVVNLYAPLARCICQSPHSIESGIQFQSYERCLGPAKSHPVSVVVMLSVSLQMSLLSLSTARIA